jgi:hypothetical protein
MKINQLQHFPPHYFVVVTINFIMDEDMWDQFISPAAVGSDNIQQDNIMNNITIDNNNPVDDDEAFQFPSTAMTNIAKGRTFNSLARELSSSKQTPVASPQLQSQSKKARLEEKQAHKTFNNTSHATINNIRLNQIPFNGNNSALSYSLDDDDQPFTIKQEIPEQNKENRLPAHLPFEKPPSAASDHSSRSAAAPDIPAGSNLSFASLAQTSLNQTHIQQPTLFQSLLGPERSSTLLPRIPPPPQPQNLDISTIPGPIGKRFASKGKKSYPAPLSNAMAGLDPSRNAAFEHKDASYRTEPIDLTLNDDEDFLGSYSWQKMAEEFKLPKEHPPLVEKTALQRSLLILMKNIESYDLNSLIHNIGHINLGHYKGAHFSDHGALRCPWVVCYIVQFTRFGSGEAQLELRDQYASITASMHEECFNLVPNSYEPFEISQGAALLLRNTPILAIPFLPPCLSITREHIVRVFPAREMSKVPVEEANLQQQAESELKFCSNSATNNSRINSSQSSSVQMLSAPPPRAINPQLPPGPQQAARNSQNSAISPSSNPSPMQHYSTAAIDKSLFPTQFSTASTASIVSRTLSAASHISINTTQPSSFPLPPPVPFSGNLSPNNSSNDNFAVPAARTSQFCTAVKNPTTAPSSSSNITTIDDLDI